jgi:hypothetical protein
MKYTFLSFLRYFIRIIFFPLIFLRRKVRYYIVEHFTKEATNYIYYRKFKKHIDWDNPKDLNEKIQWLKIYSDTSKWPDLADKFKVREYIKSKGLGHTLNDLYAVWDSVDKIDISDLPDSFVLKKNSGSGDILIVQDKFKYTNKEIQKYFNKFNVYGIPTAEPHYFKIKPCIIAEKLLVDKYNSSSLMDYKFFCSQGEPIFINVYSNRTLDNAFINMYDPCWKWMPEALFSSEHKKKNQHPIPIPQSFEEMKSMSKLIAIDFPFVRIDWYEIDGKPIFGEITFTPCAGLYDYITQEMLPAFNLEVQHLAPQSPGGG